MRRGGLYVDFRCINPRCGEPTISPIRICPVCRYTLWAGGMIVGLAWFVREVISWAN